MADEIRQTGKRLSGAALTFFAFVGFVASVVTVVQYFKPAEASSLSVSISPHKFLVPMYAAGPLQDGKSARVFVDGLRLSSCRDQDQSNLIASDIADIKKNLNDQVKFEKARDCKDFIDIEFAGRWSGEYSESTSMIYEYSIKNDGAKTANGIKIQAGDLNSLQYKRGRTYVDVRKEDNGEYFKLPDLNPRESLTVFAWANAGNVKDLSYSDVEDFPLVTYSGYSVSTELYKPIPDGWYELFDFF